MKINKLTALLLMAIIIEVLNSSVSFAGDAPAPEIPAGFGPAIASGVAFSIAAVKNYFNK